MKERLLLLVVMPSLFLMFNPAYAEVTSLQTDRELYSIDMQISFTGTIASGDAQKLVNLMIQDPSGKIVLMTGGFAEPNGTFHITVNTNDESQFSIKGTYSATAFVNEKSTGRTIFFNFSPDGSPVAYAVSPQSVGNPYQNGGENATSYGSESKHYEYSLYENPGISDVVGTLKNSSPLISKHLTNSYNVSGIVYPVMIASGGVIVGLIFYHRLKRSKEASKDNLPKPSSQEESDSDYALMILKNRLAKGDITVEEFKATKEALSES